MVQLSLHVQFETTQFYQTCITPVSTAHCVLTEVPKLRQCVTQYIKDTF